MIPTQEQMFSLFTYDPELGHIKWRHDRISKLKSGNVVIKAKAGDIAGTNHLGGYRTVRAYGKNYLAHRVIWLMMTGDWPTHQIDHINGNRSDNRFCNLRSATQNENMLNRSAQKNSTTGIKGVSWDKREQRFVVRLKVGDKYRSFGQYRSLDEAERACRTAASEHHKEFARVM